MIRPAAALLCAALFAAPALAAEPAPAASSAPAEAAAPRRPALVVDTLAHGRFDLQARRGRLRLPIDRRLEEIGGAHGRGHGGGFPDKGPAGFTGHCVLVWSHVHKIC